MSQTSKVNPSLRQAILNHLDTYGSTTNIGLYYDSLCMLPSPPSLRTIREATQKLTKDGTLVRTGNKFSIAPATGNTSAATV